MKRGNGADTISAALWEVSTVLDRLNEQGVSTGRARFWLRLSSALAGAFGVGHQRE